MKIIQIKAGSLNVMSQMANPDKYINVYPNKQDFWTDTLFLGTQEELERVREKWPAERYRLIEVLNETHNS